MKQKKHVFLLTAVLCLTLLPGCGTTKKDVVDTPDEATEAIDTKEAVITPEVTVAPIASTYEPGSINDNAYENEWLNLRYVAPEDVTLADKAQMDVAMGTSTDFLDGAATNETLEEATKNTIYEMLATHSDGITSVSVMVENPTDLKLTADDYLAALKEGLNSSQLGYTFEESVEDTEIAGESYTALNGQVDLNGHTLQQRYYCREHKGAVVVIILTHSSDTPDNTETIMSGFQPF